MAKKIDIIRGISSYPKVSILVPAHNEEKVIERSILAMLKLDYPREKLEIIIINDNSTDRTGEILSRLQSNTRTETSKSLPQMPTTAGRVRPMLLTLA